MSVAFTQGQTIGRGDLDITLTNTNNNATNAYSITFAIYYVDPASQTEVLIGPEDRVPVNPAVGEYYASLMVPASAQPGDYRIRWTFQELSTSPEQQVVQEFAVVAEGTVTSTSTLSTCQADLIHKLRIMLRDNCVGAEEMVELDVAGERVVVRLDDLYDAVGDMVPGNC